MSSSTLVDFLLARIAEDEEVARAVCDFFYSEGRWRWADLMVPKSALVDERRVLMLSAEGDGPTYMVADHIARHDPARVLAECAAKRGIVELESAPRYLGEWTPDCGGDWCLSGDGYFANYWPNHTVSASIYERGRSDGDAKLLADQGIVEGSSKADCQAKAEVWIRENIATSSPVLRQLASVYADSPGFRPEWALKT